jgi:hypothetical protein
LTRLASTSANTFQIDELVRAAIETLGCTMASIKYIYVVLAIDGHSDRALEAAETSGSID